MVTDTQGGVKHDADKPDLTLVSQAFVEQVALAMMDGQRKYGRYNYLKGMKVLRLCAAALRHVFAYVNGEECAKDSGIHHLAHAAANFNMIFDLQAKGTLEDDRYKVTANNNR